MRDADPGRGERLVIERRRLAGGGAQDGAIARGCMMRVYTRNDLKRKAPQAGRRKPVSNRLRNPHARAILTTSERPANGRFMREARPCAKGARRSGTRGAEYLSFGAGALAALSAGGAVIRTAFADEGAPTEMSPDEALARLKAGNEAYVRDPELCSVDLARRRASVAAHQAPWATIVACADSRVPPELIFGGRGVGELSSHETRETLSTSRRSARSNTARRFWALRSSSFWRIRGAARSRPPATSC